MAMDTFPVLGHQMTHSVDSFITDSANSATALYTGHKSTVNALGVYADSSSDPFDDPKVETVAEMFHRLNAGGIGIVSTAYIADATPSALTAHTRDRSAYADIVNFYLNGITNYTWTDWDGPDVLFGGGAEQFYANEESYEGEDFYDNFAQRGYEVVQNNTALAATGNSSKTLGIFSTGNLAVWLDRNVYPENLNVPDTAPDGSSAAAVDQPGLKEMTLKAIDILTERHPDDGYFMMAEAASVDKQMHALDYDRALGDLLELDNTVEATLKHLEALGTLEDTLVIVTADHGHGFDVAGSVDTEFQLAQRTDREKRKAVGIYEQSGLSQYTSPNESAPLGSDQNLVYSAGAAFPANWDPRYTLLQGVMAFPDRRENYTVHAGGPRDPTVTADDGTDGYVANPEDGLGGITIQGNLLPEAPTGVHSLTDVPVFALGPCQELFGGTYQNTDIFYNMAQCLGLSRPSPRGGHKGESRKGHGRKGDGHKGDGPKDDDKKGGAGRA